jgi:hypothetical protein
MHFRIPIPMFILRKLARQHPWLLADNGVVRDTSSISFGPLTVYVETETVIGGKSKAILQAEADAGTLFR